jgi:hypothetical protein
MARLFAAIEWTGVGQVGRTVLRQEPGTQPVDHVLVVHGSLPLPVKGSYAGH